MPKTALVTGGAGFIGSHMAGRLLQEGLNVVVLDNESTGHRENVPREATYILGDVTHAEDVALAFEHGIDIVFHIAGQASTILSFGNPSTDLTTNTIGSLNILEACLAYRVPRVLYASSMTVYGHPETLPVAEDSPARPISYYGISKYAAERYLITTTMRNDLDFDFAATAFRMFNVYGARQRLDNPYQGVMGIFIGNALREETIHIFGDGEQSRDFVHIDDVVDVWMAAMDNSDSYGEVFNVGNGQDISINRLVDEILSANRYSRLDWPIQYGPSRPGDQRKMVADISKAKNLLDWQPKIALDEGLQRTLAWGKREVQ